MLNRKSFFKFGSFLCLIVAGYHFVGIFYEISAASPYRHAFFVVINLFCSYGFIRRPKLFIFFFLILFIQQLYSHGGSLIRHWKINGSIDLIDLFVVIIIPFFFINLLIDWKSRFSLLLTK